MKAIDELKSRSNINYVNYLTKTKEKNFNIEHLNSLKELNSSLVYKYILRCFQILEEENISSKVYYYVSETLKWSDVAKAGSKEDRKLWKKKNFDLFVHNISSSQIYVLDNKNYDEVVRVLIKTHGLIGQYIRGEVSLDKNRELYELIDKKLIDRTTLKEVLIVLNKCVIGAVSKDLYVSIEKEVKEAIDNILNNNFDTEINVFSRLQKLNKHITKEDLKILEDDRIKDSLEKVLTNLELWYFESALKDFTFEEQIKILLIIHNYLDLETKHVTFEKVMKMIYLDYKGNKETNIYEKRIIEKMLEEINFYDILDNNVKENPHVKYKVNKKGNTLIFNFVFSIQAQKLIEFCEVAYTMDSIYNKSVYMLYDLFGFRRDEYDRFYNEIDYLNTMNLSTSNKKIILNYITPKNILDVGPGGGALMDLIEKENPSYNVYGIDIADNVIEKLKKKKASEKRNWHIVQGNALKLEDFFKERSIDTIIYSSIIHELFSYIEYNGKKFNIETVIKALKSAYQILSKKGRIIIRDGIKTEPENQYRIIEFKNKEDINILNNYCNDFKGRKVSYQKIDDRTVKMLVNDAMEFLYTYTWGENSYSLEVKEQFGYLTPSEYVSLIKDNLENAKIIECKSFLQKGYEENLLNKITIYDENMEIVSLPDSTCIIVIEKE